MSNLKNILINIRFAHFFFPPPLSFSVLASIIFVSYEDSNVLCRIKFFMLDMKIAMYYVESKLPVRFFFLSAR